MTLEHQHLGDLKISSPVSNTEQISSYAEKTFVHIDGDSNIGTLNLSGNLIVGNAAAAITPNTAAIGYNVMAGCMGFIIISGDLNANTITLSGDISILSDLADTNVEYSVKLNREFDFVGKILDIDVNNSTVSCDCVPNRISSYYSVVTGKNAIGRYDTLSGELSNVLSGWEMLSDGSVQERTNRLWIPSRPSLGNILLSENVGQVAVGMNTKSLGTASFACGVETIAGGYWSYAEGDSTVAGHCAHAEGKETFAHGYASHASGYKTVADKYVSQAEGCYSKASHEYSYVWNGNDKMASTPYESKETGSYCINPKNGLNGFYVGDKNLNDIITQMVNDIIVNREKASKITSELVISIPEDNYEFILNNLVPDPLAVQRLSWGDEDVIPRQLDESYNIAETSFIRHMYAKSGTYKIQFNDGFLNVGPFNHASDGTIITQLDEINKCILGFSTLSEKIPSYIQSLSQSMTDRYFRGCTNMTNFISSSKIDLSNFKYFGHQMFQYCKSMNSLEIPLSAQAIRETSFYLIGSLPGAARTVKFVDRTADDVRNMNNYTTAQKFGLMNGAGNATIQVLNEEKTEYIDIPINDL